MHEEKALDFRVRAYYKFTDPLNRWRDAFRNQTARPIALEPQVLAEPLRIDPFCSQLPEKLVQLPKITGNTQKLFPKLPIYIFDFNQRDFGYTLTLWLRNDGTHSYSKDSLQGRNNHHLFELSNSFALWWDSPISFRVYIYARSNANELYTAPVSVPLREWVNIQLAISKKGITIMTFNANGQRLQVIE